jgi:hypothetical protein
LHWPESEAGLIVIAFGKGDVNTKKVFWLKSENTYLPLFKEQTRSIGKISN